MFFSYLLRYLSEGEYICTRPKVKAFPREGNTADMKNPCDNLYIAYVAIQCNLSNQTDLNWLKNALTNFHWFPVEYIIN